MQQGCAQSPPPLIACWKSARAAYEQSKQHWTQLIWNADLRHEFPQLYDELVATDHKDTPRIVQERAR
jgi:hypothetical protein